MAPRKNPKGGSPAPGARRETKHGNKNGKKEGVSGSSFFTWFMVIALLGVWTSVAVVWFELVDYEEVLGKLGIYDADGDGDFDVEDAKILLGLKERSVIEQPTPRDAEEVIQQPSEQPHIRTGHRNAEAEPEDEIQSLLREALNSQLGETDEEHEDEGTQFQQEENTEMPEDTVDVPVVEESYDRELEDNMPGILATPESFQEEPTSEHEGREPELDEPHGMHEYDTDEEENTYEPIEPDASELTLEDALVHETETFSEREEQQDYVDEHEMENEDYIETRDTVGEPVTEHYYEALAEETLQDEVDTSETIIEHTESDEGEHEKDRVDGQPRETEVPVHTESHSKDNLVDT